MQVRISETYDLSTVTDKMSLIGIHTPTLTLAKKLWPGLFQNFKYMKFVKCDVAMACASTLPADPLQIGTEAGDIAPQDMFNPILYKACSNDSYNTLLNRITSLGGTDAGYVSTAYGPSVSANNDPEFPASDGTSAVDQWELYYGLLAEPTGWKKSMPQSGLVMKGLFPVVFQTYANMGPLAMISAADGSPMGQAYETSKTGVASAVARVMRGPAVRMPMFPTHVGGTGTMGGTEIGTMPSSDGVAQDLPPRCYVGAVIMPPCKLNRLYYRMKVTWTLEFIGLAPSTDIATYANIAAIGETSYATDYATQSASMTSLTEMVDVKDASITKIMEGA